MTEPLKLAVVGHTNVGKTSLLRTLTRDVGFGEVSHRPSTTRHVEGARLSVDGEPLLELYDTPGLEDAIALLDYLERLERPGERLDGPARLARFLQGSEARQRFDGLGFGSRLGHHAAPAGGAIEQQLGDQAFTALMAGLALRLLVVDQPLQGRAGVFQQQGQAFVQAALAVFRRGHAVEPHQGVKAKPGKGFTPFGLAVLAAGDEVEHG